MTFYEAALLILSREGKPLHAREITELAIKENLLSHVGMQPDVTMASRLAAMARRSEDRRLVAVEPDTFGLVDWSVIPSDAALELSGVVETHDETEPLLRSRERHPKVDKENVRVAGRGDRRRKYEELERKKKRKKKRLPPLADLAWEIVDRAGRALPLFEMAAAIREQDLVGEDIGREALELALRAENERREGEDRKPVFEFFDEGLVGLVGHEEPEEEADLPALVAKIVGKLAEERKPAAEAALAPIAAIAGAPLDQVVAAERDRAIGLLRQRLSELEAPALESVTQTMLETLGFREVRVAKRHKDGGLFTCRRRMGLTEVRYAVRVLRGGREVRREDVLELRRDMQSHSAQMGVVLSPSDVTREGRSEASNAAGALVTLLCADALADQLAERGLGVRQRTVTFTEFDPASFRNLAGGAPAPAAAAGAPQAGRETASDRRERRERERREWREKRAQEREERRKAREAAAQTAFGGVAAEDMEAAEAAGLHPVSLPLREGGLPPHALDEPESIPEAEATVAPAPAVDLAAPTELELVALAEAEQIETEPVPADEAQPTVEEVMPAAPEAAAAMPIPPAAEEAIPAVPEATVAAPAAARAKPAAREKAAAAPAPAEEAPAAPAAEAATAEAEEAAPERPRRRRRRTRTAAEIEAETETPAPEGEAAPAVAAETSQDDES